jgi:phosphoribosylcarboxyaminoimidazole (NCAIR) mutase
LFDMVFDALEHQEQQRKLQVLTQEQGMAATLGGMNAARPQSPAPLATSGPLTPEQAAPTALTPRQ